MSWDSSKSTLSGLNTELSEVTNLDSDYTATSHYSEWITLNPGESAQLQIESVFGSTGSDMYWRIVETLDASSENADTVGRQAGSLGFVASSTVRRTITVTGPYKFRVEVRKGGTTAGTYTPNVYMRKNGISI